MPPVRLAATALAAAWLLAGGMLAPGTMIALLASVAALVAARERRHRDMALAAGLAAGVSSIGLALLPVLLGIAIAGRTLRRSAPAFAGAALTGAWLIGWSPGTGGSLSTIAPADLAVLIAATATGTAAWLAARCSARLGSPSEIDAACLIAGLSLPLLLPMGIEAIGIAVALAIGGTRPTWPPLTSGANDNPLPLRPTAA